MEGERRGEESEFYEILGLVLSVVYCDWYVDSQRV